MLIKIHCYDFVLERTVIVPLLQQSVTVRRISACIGLHFVVLWTVFFQIIPWFPTLLYSHLWIPEFCRVMQRPSQDQKWVSYERGTWCRQIQGSSTLGGGDSPMKFTLPTETSRVLSSSQLACTSYLICPLLTCSPKIHAAFWFTKVAVLRQECTASQPTRL